MACQLPADPAESFQGLNRILLLTHSAHVLCKPTHAHTRAVSVLSGTLRTTAGAPALDADGDADAYREHNPNVPAYPYLCSLILHYSVEFLTLYHDPAKAARRLHTAPWPIARQQYCALPTAGRNLAGLSEPHSKQRSVMLHSLLPAAVASARPAALHARSAVPAARPAVPAAWAAAVPTTWVVVIAA